MVAPVVVAAGIAAATAIAQAYQSEKARNANQRTLDQMRKAFEAIVPPEYSISIEDPSGLQRIPNLQLDFSRVTPEAFKVIGAFAPQVAPTIAESAPQLVTGNAVSQEGRQGQIAAYRQMLAESKGTSPELAIRLREANENAQRQAQSRQASVLEDSQRRGLFGSGVQLAAQLSGTGNAMAEGARAGREGALAAYQNKLQSVRSAGDMGRQLAQDELSQQQLNAQIINDFNQRTSRAAQTQINLQNEIQNQAALRNLNQQQTTADKNTALMNDTQRYNLENRNRLATTQYQADVNEREYQNQLKQLAYADRMNLERAKQGLGAQEIGMRNQSTADRNQILQGLGNAGMGYYQQTAADARSDKNFDRQRQLDSDYQDREDARWDKYYNNRNRDPFETRGLA